MFNAGTVVIVSQLLCLPRGVMRDRRRPRLVIDVRALTRQRDGNSTYILGVVPRLLSLASGWERTIIVDRELVRVVEGWECEIAFNGSSPMRLAQHVTIPRLNKRLRPDVFFYPAHDPPLFSVGAPLVMTVHDVTPFLLHPYFESWDRPKRAYLRFVLARGLRRAERVIAVSNTTKEGIGEVFGKAASDKTTVVYNAVASPSSETKGTNRHFLYLGTDRPHKNLLRLIDGYASASQGRSDIPPLVLVGGFRSEGEVRDVVAKAGVSHAVTFAGHVPDDRVDELMREAIALVVPSIAEGFGLPILEAMARGLPVITSDRSACREIAAEAALIIDPFDPAAIAAAIIRVATDGELRKRLRVSGLQRASVFSWDAAARATLDVIESARRADIGETEEQH